MTSTVSKVDKNRRIQSQNMKLPLPSQLLSEILSDTPIYKEYLAVSLKISLICILQCLCFFLLCKQILYGPSFFIFLLQIIVEIMFVTLLLSIMLIAYLKTFFSDRQILLCNPLLEYS